MSKKYAVYRAVGGSVDRVVNCSEDDIEQQVRLGESFLECDAERDDTHYVNAGLFVVMPPRPSEFHTFNYGTKQWVDPRTLSDFKATQWSAIKAARSAAEYAGFAWSGFKFDSDQVSQQKIQGALQMSALVGAGFSVGWTLFDNTVRVLNSSDIAQVALALALHVNARYETARTLRNQIEAATTQAQVEAIVWPV